MAAPFRWFLGWRPNPAAASRPARLSMRCATPARRSSDTACMSASSRCRPGRQAGVYGGGITASAMCEPSQPSSAACRAAAAGSSCKERVLAWASAAIWAARCSLWTRSACGGRHAEAASAVCCMQPVVAAGAPGSQPAAGGAQPPTCWASAVAVSAWVSAAARRRSMRPSSSCGQAGVGSRQKAIVGWHARLADAECPARRQLVQAVHNAVHRAAHLGIQRQLLGAQLGLRGLAQALLPAVGAAPGTNPGSGVSAPGPAA